MTREEAIEILEDLYGYFSDNQGRDYDEAFRMAISALSADRPQGDGRNNIKRYPNCHMRTSLGNCDAIGWFCTSINAPICDAFHKVSRPQGKWISNHDGSWNCSECELRVFIYAKGNYCPNCGAKMEYYGSI